MLKYIIYYRLMSKYRGTYSNTAKTDDSKMKRDFYNYADAKEKKILEAGMQKMAKTLGVDMYEEIFFPYFFYKCGCKSAECIEESEYVKGLRAFSSNTLADAKKSILSTKENLLELGSKDYIDFYNYLFTLNCDQERRAGFDKPVKFVEFEVYSVYFQKLFAEQFPFVAEFVEWMDKEQKQPKMDFDQWSTFRDFLLDKGTTFPKDYKPGIDWYNSLVDIFYKYYCTKHHIRQEGDDSDEEI